MTNNSVQNFTPELQRYISADVQSLMSAIADHSDVSLKLAVAELIRNKINSDLQNIGSSWLLSAISQAKGNQAHEQRRRDEWLIDQHGIYSRYCDDEPLAA